jgi:hypothetical protein
MQSDVLRLPITTNNPEFPVVQYADDIILVLSAELDQIVALKDIMHKFGISTGLKVNFHKSLIIPMKVEPSTISLLASTLGCQIGSLHFPYLGLPLGTTGRSIEELMPIVHGLERRLTATSIFLSQGARFTAYFISSQLNASVFPFVS